MMTNRATDGVRFDEPYRSGPQAWTDLHAGGLLFYVVYEELIEFRRDGGVSLWYEVLDDSRDMDNEGEEYRRRRHSGSYCLNERGYLECSFPEFNLVGAPCAEAPDLLVFYTRHRRGG